MQHVHVAKPYVSIESHYCVAGTSVAAKVCRKSSGYTAAVVPSFDCACTGTSVVLMHHGHSVFMLDRLPARSVKTHDYSCLESEASNGW